jgi:hypothetical protein
MTLPLAKTPATTVRDLGGTLRASLMSTWPLILCLVVLVALSVLSLALAAHWLAPSTHLPGTLGVIPHPWGCGGSSTTC